MSRAFQVTVVGLGTIARTHTEVLRSLVPGVRIVGVDPRGEAAAAAGSVDAVHTDLASTLASGPPPDLWVLATPTPAHLDHVAAVLAAPGAAPVLVEKPLVPSVAALTELERLVPLEVLRARVRVSHHFAFSPEVRWVSDARAALGLGEPRRVTMSFHDPYSRKSTAEQASYGNPWLDSGPNQLSVLMAVAGSGGERLDVRVDEVDLVEGGMRAHARGTVGAGGTFTAMTSWLAADSSKETVLVFADGTELWLDHTAVTGVALRDGRPVLWSETDGTVPRKVLHYRPLYETLLSGAAEDAADALAYDTAASIVRLLDRTALA